MKIIYKHRRGFVNDWKAWLSVEGNKLEDGEIGIVDSDLNDNPNHLRLLVGDGEQHTYEEMPKFAYAQEENNSVVSQGYDYAEYFKWANDVAAEYRTSGRFVTIAENTRTIRPAQPDDKVLGITSNTASIIGNWAENNRSAEDGWAVVGMLGIVEVKHDHTCTKNGYAMIGANGVATKTDDPFGYKVVNVNDEAGTIEVVLGNDSDMISRIKAELDSKINTSIIAAEYASKQDAANAVRARVSGKTITIADVSPLPHKLRVEVKGTNMIEYPYNGGSIANGITYTDNGDGTITADGTSSSFSVFTIRKPNEEAVYLEAGKTYRLSGAPVEAGIVMPLMVVIGEENFYDFGEGVTFTPATSGYPYIRIYASSIPASVSNLKFKPHLYEVVDVSSVKIGCNGAAYYPSADGVLEIDSKTLNTAEDFQDSFCPYAYISNTAGYTLEVTYNKNPIATAKDIESKLKQHVDTTDNPHNVTAGQVGLGNVDNTSDMDKPVSTAMQRALNDIEAIAKGRATGYVFDTVEDLDTWLSDTANTSKLVLGDSLYIRDTSVPDYWWDGTTKQELETQKVDLTEYVKNTDYATWDKGGVIKASPSDYGIGVNARGLAYIRSASTSEIDDKTSDYHPITPKTLAYAVKSIGDGYYATEEQVGDISAALDELHAYAQALIGGDA